MGGWLFGKSTGQTPATNLRISSSLQGKPKPIGWGQNRLAATLIWYDFGGEAASKGSGGGKGGIFSGLFGGSSSQPNYVASLLYSLADGPLASAPSPNVCTVFNGQSLAFAVAPSIAVQNAYAALGIALPAIYGLAYTPYASAYVAGGDYAQTAWSYLASAFPASALAYRGEALFGLPNFSLGSNPAAPSLNFEVLWPINSAAPSLGPDATAADVIVDFITNPDKGMQGFPGPLLGTLSDFKNYCLAAGLFVSPVLTDAVVAQSFLNDLMVAHAAEFRWSAGTLTVVPYLDIAVTGNGVTYTPATTPAYNFTVDHFLPNQGTLGQAVTADKTPIAVSRTNPTQVPNKVQVEYLDRNFLYNPVTIYASNDAMITATGKLRLSDLRAHHFFCLNSSAVTSAAMQLAREQVVTAYQFTVGAQFILLDVLDVVTITGPANLAGGGPALGLNQQLVRITEIQENQDHSLTVTAEEVPGTLAANVYASQATLGAAQNQAAAPDSVNTPLIWEPPAPLLTDNAPQVWFAASGGASGLRDPNWGGDYVWISLDNTNYVSIGQITAAARQGVLTAGLPAFASTNPDSTDTLSVNLSESGGLLSTATAGEAANGVTLFLVDQELMAYATATLVSGSNYNLTTLYRGFYGTGSPSHANGAPFCMLDASTVFKYNLPTQFVGQTLYVKFQSFNVFGGAPQALSSCTAYTYTPTGSSALGPVAQDLAAGLSMDWGLIGAPVALSPGTQPTTLSDTFGIVSDPYSAPIALGTIGS